MSLYNMINGFEPTAPLVLEWLDLSPMKIPRFRDAYVTYREQDDPQAGLMMVVLTRTGGANRGAYEPENAMLRGLAGFIADRDDTFDTTFALFCYDLPDAHVEAMTTYLTEFGPPLSLLEKTQQASGPDQTKRQKAGVERLKTILEQAISRED